jgi:hypothetical protein
MKCPNVKHPDFKSLEQVYGFDYALYLYDQNNQEIPTLDQAKKIIQNKRSNDPLFNEALMSTDNELSNFIMGTLQKNYPGIKLFNNKDEFLSFVEKNGGDINNVSITAIGHAFQNSIFIDENEAVQSTYFHENAHIYWDALPKSNKIKNKLMDLFSEEGMTESEIEEAIITNIGIAGVSLAEVQLRGNKLEKFVELLKQLWAEIKNHLHIASQKDLVRIVANDVWTNKEKFNDKVFVENAMRNMEMNPLNIEIDDTTKAFMYGDEMWTSVSRAIGMLSIFNADEAANAMYNKLLREKNDNNDDNAEELDTFEKREQFIKMQKNRWKVQAEVGTGIHNIAQSIINGIPFEQIPDIIINDRTGSKIKDYFSPDVLQDTYNKINRVIGNMTDKGWKIYSEITLGSLDHKMAGIADVVMEKDGKLAVLDFKSFFEEDRSDRRSGSYLRFPLETMQDTKKNKHQLQVDIYANMLETQENKDVAFTAIIPFIYEMDGEQVSKFDEKASDPKVVRRKPRKSTIKDRNRKNAKKLMDHVSKINEARKTIIQTNEDIEKLSKNKNLDKDLLKEQQQSIIALTSIFGRLDDVPYEYVERLLESGISFMSEKMINSLGYNYEDIFGNEEKDIAPMTAEEFLMRSYQSKKPNEEVDRVDYEDKDAFRKRIFEKRHVKGIDFGTNDFDSAYKRYVAERKALESIYEEMEDVHGIQKMKENKLDSIYRKVINMSSEEGQLLKSFIEDIKVARIMTDKLQEENSGDYYGYKYATVFLGRTIRFPDRLYTDFKSYNAFNKYFKNILKVDKKHVLVQILGAELLNEHRKTVMESEIIRSTLEKYVNDSEDNGRKKKSTERKKLKNEDFEDIIYTDPKSEFMYFQTPSKAREILEEKYGEEDPRPRNMARYLSELTDKLVQNDDRLRSIARSRQPNIMVPELQQKPGETFSELNGTNKIHTARVYRLFRSKEYDNISIRHKGEEKRLIDFKDKIYNSLQEKNEIGESISKELEEMEILDSRANEKHGVSKKAKRRKTVYVIGKQTGRTILKTKNYNAAIQEYLTSVIEAKRMERTIPLAEYTHDQYKNHEAEGMSSFLEAEISHKIYKNVRDIFDSHWTTKNLPNFLIAWTAKKALGFGILSNITNRTMGAFWNTVRHPQSMLRSYSRRFQNFGGKRSMVQRAVGVDQFRKLGGIMKSTNIGTVMQDVTFSKYKRLLDVVNEVGFKPLAITEVYNQGELLRGIITEKEYQAYNKKGKPLRISQDGEVMDPDTDRSKWSKKKQIQWNNKWEKSEPHPDTITENRANEIAAILSEVHGYFGFNKSQWSYYKFGRMVGMFTLSWAQSAFNIMYEEKQTDFTGRQKTGLVNSFLLNSKISLYNVFMSTAKKEKEISKVNEKYFGGSGFKTRKEAEVKLYELDRYTDPNEYITSKKIDGKTLYFVPGIDTDLSEFEKVLSKKIDSKDGLKIKKEDVDIIDRQNMLRLLNMMIITGIGYTLKTLIGNWDDDIIYGEEHEIGGGRRGKARPLSQLSEKERFTHHILNFIEKRLLMAGEDAWFFVNPLFYARYFQSPPALQTLGQVGRVMSDMYHAIAKDKKGYYMNATLEHSYMEPKYQDKIMSELPYLGQPYKVAKRLTRFATDAVYEEDLKKRADDMYEYFRKDIIAKSSAATELTDSQISIEDLRKFIDDNEKDIKKYYLDIEMLNDIKQSKYWENELYKKFYDYVRIFKEIEAETEVERRLDSQITDEEIKRRKEELESQIK